MSIDSKMFDELSELSMLSFNNKEKEAMLSELNEMIAFLEQIEDIDVDDTKNILSIGNSKLAPRTDTGSATTNLNKIERNAPNFEDGYFVC